MSVIEDGMVKDRKEAECWTAMESVETPGDVVVQGKNRMESSDDRMTPAYLYEIDSQGMQDWNQVKPLIAQG